MAKGEKADTKVVVQYSGELEDINKLLDNPTSWFVSVCSSLASLIVVGVLYSFGIFFPILLKEFGEAKATTAFVGSLSLGSMGFFGPVSAKLIGHFGCRLVMMCGGLTCAIGLFASSFSPNIFVLLVTFGICFGFGSSFVYIAAFQVIPLYFERHRSLASSFASVGPGIGLLLMSPIIQTLLDYFDWRKTFMILAGVNLVPCILGCSIKRRAKPGGLTVETEVVQKEKPSTGRYRTCNCTSLIDISVIKDPEFILLCSSMVIVSLALSIPTAHLAKYTEDLGIPSHLLYWFYVTIGITSAVSRILVGKLGDTGWISLIHIYQVGGIFGAINQFTLPFLSGFGHIIAYCSVFGIVEGFIASPMHCNMLSLFPGEGFGWYMCFISISALIGPIVAGLIADLSGSYHPAFIVAGALFLISSLLLFLHKYVRKSDRKQIEMAIDTERESVIYEKVTVL